MSRSGEPSRTLIRVPLGSRHLPQNPLRHRSGEPSPPRCSDVSFIVKHLPCAVDPETALHGKPYAPTQGGWTRKIPQFRAADDEASAYVDVLI